ncbi:hypothetical protein [Kribbella sp. NPDC051718]|uniref:hypothetical protein n=1 Tax=Kribbella sp. NPDC051718 TaxID=3155168 RepID=UPI0034399BE9
MSEQPPPEALANTSMLGRLLEEISWEGRLVRGYRNGGRGRENVLTAEVLGPLSYLPRSTFLAAVFRAAHGADETRELIAREAEEARITLLPDESKRPAHSCYSSPRTHRPYQSKATAVSRSKTPSTATSNRS